VYVLESLVYEQDKHILHAFFWTTMRLIECSTSKMDETEARSIENIIEELQAGVNQNAAAYSRIHKIIEQPEEFVKTPTKK
jgi:long-chain acyl-CoA synthetase